MKLENAFTCYLSSDWKWNLTHPLKTIKAVYRGIIAAWQRATRGFSNYDIYDLDDWLLHLLPDALEEFTKHNIGYPSNDKEIKDFETWQNFLTELAKDFRACQSEEVEKSNEYYEEYMKKFDDPNWTVKSPRTKIDTLYFNRCKELAAEQQERIERTFARLAKRLQSIWW